MYGADGSEVCAFVGLIFVRVSGVGQVYTMGKTRVESVKEN